MIEVVKHGEPKKQVTCKHCEAVLRYSITDIKKRFYRHGINGMVVGECDYIICPDCKREIILAQTR